MKIYIRKHTADTGKGKFLQRLVPELERLGITVSHDPDADIYFDIGRFHESPKCRKRVLRLGPAHVDTNKKYKLLNHIKWKSAKVADGIVYQSAFSRKVCRTFLGKPTGLETVIHNGADPMFYAAIKKPPEAKGLQFCAVARKWIPQKRLKDIIESFRLANLQDSVLHIAGDTLGAAKKYNDERIRFLGSLDDTALGALYRRCDAMIHAVYLDACPNTVVEAMVAGCHVIATDQGGTRELTPDIVRDKPYDFRPIDLNHPPKVNCAELARKICAVERGMALPWAKSFYIDAIAGQYKAFFEKMMG